MIYAINSIVRIFGDRVEMPYIYNSLKSQISKKFLVKMYLNNLNSFLMSELTCSRRVRKEICYSPPSCPLFLSLRK